MPSAELGAQPNKYPALHGAPAQGPGPGGDAQQRLSPEEEKLMVGFLREREAVTLTPFLQVGGSL